MSLGGSSCPLFVIREPVRVLLAIFAGIKLSVRFAPKGVAPESSALSISLFMVSSPIFSEPSGLDRLPSVECATFSGLNTTNIITQKKVVGKTRTKLLLFEQSDLGVRRRIILGVELTTIARSATENSNCSTLV